MLTTECFNTPDFRLIECDCAARVVQRHLNDCREERRPYLFVTPMMAITPLRRILVPVSMLEEEVYKSEICTYLARTYDAHIILLQAKDYGSRARQNVHRIVTHIDSIAAKIGKPISYEVVEARTDSFHIIRESAERQRDFQHDLLILTASREYGLDDILFGPPERKAILRSLVPVMLINPREDLFSLCD